MLEPTRTIKLLEKHAPQQTYASGQIIFEEGHQGDVMYGVLEGEVDMVVNGKIVETIHAGDVFGVRALVAPDHLRASTAIAKTYCRIALVDREHFMFAVQETPMFALEVIRSYSDRLTHLKHQI